MIGKDRPIRPPGEGGRSPLGREPEGRSLYGPLRGLGALGVGLGLVVAFWSVPLGGGLLAGGVCAFVLAWLYEKARLARRRDLWRKRRR